MKKIIKLIKNSNNVAVFAHTSPDGDCLGSLSAIYFLCKQLGKTVKAFIDDKIPARYKYLNLPDISDDDIIASDFDLLITVDTASCRLLGKYKDTFLNFSNTVVIDHHLNRDYVGKYNLVNSSLSACAELVYSILKTSKVKINKSIATALYSAVADDTGCFIHDNTTQSSHALAAEMIKFGADVSTSNYNLFKLTPKKTFELKNLLLNKIVVDDEIAYLLIDLKFLNQNGYIIEDLPDIVNDLNNIENIKIAFIITEKRPKSYYIKLRCIKPYNVASVAKILNGGGHKQASGALICGGKIEDALNKVLKECKKELKGKTSV